MNNYARAVIIEFMSKENEQFLFAELVRHFNDPRVYSVLSKSIISFMTTFAHRIQEEMYMSDPMPGLSLYDIVDCFNKEFLDDRAEYIRSFVINTNDDKPKYSVSDNIPTSRHGINHYKQSPNAILNTWAFNASPGIQLREDPSGDVYYFDGKCTDDICTNGKKMQYNAYSSQGDNALATGITFCDQSMVNTSNHIDFLLNNSYVQALNRDCYPHTSDAFGNATPASDARLLERRIFRNNERGEENGIPSYEQRLYKRNLERDITEGLRPGERGCLVSGYDMTELKSRVDYKNAAKAKYESTCKDRNKLALQYNSLPLPTNRK
jgi:hypothetical protein